MPGLRTTTILACGLLFTATHAAAQPVGFADPTPAASSLVTAASVQVRLDVACTFDAATLSVRMNGALLDANAFRPFGACASGRMQSQTVAVPVARPQTAIVQGPRRLRAIASATYVATTTGDGPISWSFDGASPPRTGASAVATFRAAGKFKVRARATRTQTLAVAGRASGADVAAERSFLGGDPSPAKRAVRVAMPTDVDFVNFEAGHVHPIAFDPVASRLYAVNTPEARLSIFDVGADGAPVFAGDVPVGLDPVSLAIRPGTNEVWVANHLSDTVSVVDVVKRKLLATLHPGDEPTDVAFAGGRAFVSLAGKDDRVVVYRASARRQIASLPLFSDDPRALAVSPSGDEVYAIVLESGNRTTAIFEPIVTAFGGPPPPTPARPPRLGTGVGTSLIVKQDATSGEWRDETGRDWSDAADYALPDQDVFVIDARATPPAVVRTVSGVGTTLYDLAVHPSGELWVANTDARNLVRFEPKLRGHTIDTRLTRVDPDAAAVVEIVDLNPHVDFSTTPGPANEIAASLSQPTGTVFDAAGQTLYVAALGSAKVGVLSSTGDVLARIAVGGGPSGLTLAEARSRLYVLNRFDNTISIVDTTTRSEVERIGVAGPSRFDPSPDAIRKGRRFLYDATLSGHGDSACATCHLFGNLDGLAWDLGNPQGEFLWYDDAPWVDFFFFELSQQRFDPMKGPMTTQTLRGLAGGEPFHWRGDRPDFAAFDEAFVEILGAAAAPPATDMQTFTDFVMSLHLPPNPFRAADDTLPSAIPVQAYDGSITTGDPRNGEHLFRNVAVDAGAFTCEDCHTGPTGTSNLLFNGVLELDTQDFKIPHLRNMYEKIGYATFRTGGQSGGPTNDALHEQRSGFGALHDGSVSLKEFLAADIFTLSPTDENDMFAFMLAFPSGTPSCIGQQVTLGYRDRGHAPTLARIATLLAQAQLERCDLIVKGARGGVAKGWVHESASSLRPDDPLEPLLAEADLRAALAPGDVLTYTTVPRGSGRRLGIDRDRDGFLDREEMRTGSDPTDPRSNAWSWVP